MTDRPDYSEYVAHFTSMVAIEGRPHLNAQLGPMDSLERLSNILSQRRIWATKKPFSLGHPSVAFTECPWTSLLDHASRYSRYGIGFRKELLWNKGGQPAVYLRSSYLHELKNHAEAHATGLSIHPLIPEGFGGLYTPIEREPGWPMLNGTEVSTRVDFAHEREWRVLKNFDFEYADVVFVVIDNPSDAATLPAEAIATIGEDRVLSISNYKRILELWPQ